MQPRRRQRIEIDPRAPDDCWHAISKPFLLAEIEGRILGQGVDAIALCHPWAREQHLVSADEDRSEELRPFLEKAIYPFTDARPVRIEYVINRHHSICKQCAIGGLEVGVSVLRPVAAIDMEKSAGCRRIFDR